MTQLFYPDFECSELPSRDSHAPKIGCFCSVCVTLRRLTDTLVPVVIQRSPFLGMLMHPSDITPAAPKETPWA